MVERDNRTGACGAGCITIHTTIAAAIATPANVALAISTTRRDGANLRTSTSALGSRHRVVDLQPCGSGGIEPSLCDLSPDTAGAT